MAITGRSFVDISTFAAAAEISRRAAAKAAARAVTGASWRGSRLEIRLLGGKRSRAGLVYEVSIDSLPSDVRSRITLSTQPELPLIAPLAASKNWRMDLVRAVIEAGERGSDARGKRVSDLALSARYGSGKRAGQPIPERTIRSWVASYEARGMIALARSRRADRGKARVIAWRAFDKAMDRAGVSEEAQRKTAEKIIKLIKASANDGVNSVANHQFLDSPDLRDLALAVAPNLTRPELDQMCRMPADFVRKHTKIARLAHMKRTDAGGWASNMMPTIRRDRSPLKPMEMVAADVRHSDIIIQRPDGTQATPKFIAFMDLATNRLWVSLRIMPKGQMIRREDVLAAFRDLFADPSWGVPQQLYLDNGGEFRTGPAADDLTAIAQLVRDTSAIELGIFEASELAKTGVLNSLPYRPKSKIIETIFSVFTRSIEPMFPGFVGGNRIVKKVENQGRAKAAMPGDEVQIQTEFARMIGLYNARPQTNGHIKGRSPNEAFAERVRDGWQSIVFDPREFTLAFGNDDMRRVRTGGEFQCGNELYRHDDLAILAGENVRIRIPILPANGRIPVLDDKGDVICVATTSPRFGMRDEAGAKEQGRRTGVLNNQVKGEVAGLPRSNVSEKLARALEETPKPPVPATAATVSIHPKLRQAAQEENQPPAIAPAKSRFALAAEAARELNEGIRRAG